MAYFEDWKYNEDYHRAADFFGINEYDRRDYEVYKKISSIIDIVSNRIGAKSLNDVLIQVHAIKKELGTNTIGKTLLSELSETVRIQQDTDNSKEELDKKGKELQEAIKEKPDVKKEVKDEPKP